MRLVVLLRGVLCGGGGWLGSAVGVGGDILVLLLNQVSLVVRKSRSL